MKRSHLRWLVPISLYLIAVVIILGVYKDMIYKRAASSKLVEMALAISEEVHDKDIVMNDAISAMTMSGRAMSLYSLSYNDNQIKTLLKDLVDGTELINAFVCDGNGDGYDYLGKEISIGEMEYFRTLSSEYSRGGTGLVLPDQSENSRNTEALIVSGVRFENREGGYIVGTLPIDTFYDQLFRERYIIDKVAVVTLNGDILADGRDGNFNVFDRSTSFWEQIPPGISRDTIKLSISQKNTYMGQVDGYGYVIVSPFKVAGGGAVAFITEDAMGVMTGDTMNTYSSEAWKLVIASAFLIVFVMLSYFVSDRIENRIRKKRFEAHDLDELTKLMTREAAIMEIKKYSESDVGMRGILFLLELRDIKGAREHKGDVFADEKIKEFADALYGRFRSTDIVARFSDDRFIVFLKDVFDQKDVRKQSDEMQLFLHDTRFVDADKEVTVNAGGAIYPDSGKNITETIASAEEALERSKQAGRGLLLF